MNNINAKVNIPQNTPAISPKFATPANNGVKADKISISGQKNDSYLKDNLLKKLSLNAGNNNSNTPNTSSKSEHPHETQDKTNNSKFSLRANNKAIILTGTDRDDDVNISQNKNGSITVNFNGHEKRFNKEEAGSKKIVFNLGEGNNTFFADPNIKYGFELNVGNGDNKITTGQGNDFIKAGNGNNIISSGDEHTNVSSKNSKVYKKINSPLFKGDTITVGNGNNILNSGAGCDEIITGNGNNTIDSGSEHDEITTGDGNNVIKGGEGDDNINVGTGNNEIYGGAGEDQIVTGNQSSADKLLNKKNSGNNLIYGGDGNDTIISKGNGTNIMYGESGNDIIISKSIGINKLYGGAGDDYLQGGPGNDEIHGGTGNDVIYGLDGNDYLFGDAGNDYINGGNGNDIIKGGIGKDILFGGKGADQIDAGTGKNVIIDDKAIKNSASKNKIYTYDNNNSKTTNLGKSIKLQGDDEFKARVESDLETLRALPSGRKMLEELDKTGKTTTIKELELSRQNGYASVNNLKTARINPNGTASAGSNTTIGYNPTFSLTSDSIDNLPPVGGLFHEMSHAYNMATGTLLAGYMTDTADGNNKEIAQEYQAVGLEIKNLTIDEKGDIPADISPIRHPDGTVSYNNPEGISENALRSDLNLKPRTEY